MIFLHNLTDTTGRSEPLRLTAGFGHGPAHLWRPKYSRFRASPHANPIFRLPIA